MAFKLKVMNKLRVPVKGTINDEDGNPVKFDFTLLCKRLNQTQIDKVIADKDSSVRDFLQSVVEGWESVNDADDVPIAFTTANLANVLEQPGLHTVCFGAYLKEVGATAKN